MGTVSIADQTVDDAISRPVVLADKGLVYWTTEWSGFHVARFESGMFPSRGRRVALLGTTSSSSTTRTLASATKSELQLPCTTNEHTGGVASARVAGSRRARAR